MADRNSTPPVFGRARSANSSAPSTAALTPDDATGLDGKRVLKRAIKALVRNFVTFMALTAAAAIPERVLYHMLPFDGPWTDFLSIAVTMLCATALSVAVIRGALDDFDDRRVNFTRCLWAGATHYSSALAFSMVFWLAFAIPISLVYVVTRFAVMNWLEAELIVMAFGIVIGSLLSIVLPLRMRESLGMGDCFALSAEMAFAQLPAVLTLVAAYAVQIGVISYYISPI